MKKPATIDEYISGFPEDVQGLLEQVRTAIKKAAPQSQEVISYGMPAFKYKGMLAWIGAHTKHIGLYPRKSAIVFFEKELSKYHTAKGSVQFPFDKPMPSALITKIIKFRVNENEEKESMKKKK